MNFRIFLHITAGKKNKAGAYPLKVALDVNGKRLQFALPRLRLKPEEWDAEAQRARPDAPEAESINLLLQRVNTRYQTACFDFETDRQIAEAAEIKKILLGKENAILTLEQLFAAYLNHYETRQQAGKTAKATLRHYRHMVSILSAYFAGEKIRFAPQVKNSTQESLYLYCLQQGLHQNTTVAVLRTLKAFFNYCLENELVERNPIARVKHQREHGELVYLEAHQLEAIRELQNLPASLDIARDAFLFSCATGLAYADLAQVNRRQVIREPDRNYLLIKRKKSKSEGHVPLFAEADAILWKYDALQSDEARQAGAGIFPVATYSYYLERLKQLFVLAGIEKRATTHIGRKTFANRMLNTENVPLEVVSEMLCHKNVATTQKYYAKVRLEKVRKSTAHIK